MKNVPNAKLATNPTTISNLGDIHKLLIGANATENEAAAMCEIMTGSHVGEACINHGLVKDGEVIANTINRNRNRFATIAFGVFSGICAPIAESLHENRRVKTEEQIQAEKEQKLAEWEAAGARGRRPGEGNRPRYEIELERAVGEAKRDTREKLDLPAQGRIRPELHEKFATTFRDFYTKALKALAKKYPENISADEDKIEKMVKNEIKNLAIDASAQKAAIKSNQAAAPKTQKKQRSKKVAETVSTNGVSETETVAEEVNA